MQPDILLLVCDTARADAFAPWGGPYRSPALERLAAGGVVYEQAVTPAPWTLPAHGSLFTGLLPTEHGITGETLRWSATGPSSPAAAVRAHRGTWLPETLRERGYTSFGVTCNPWVGRWGGFDRGFDAFVDVREKRATRGTGVRRLVGRARQMTSGRDHGAAAALEAFGRWIGERTAGPAFAFANLMEVHSPYDPPRAVHPFLHRTPLAGGRAGGPALLYYQFRQMGRFRTRVDPRYVSAMRSLYYAAARYQDQVVGAFVDAFVSRSRPAVVVLVSDHGENLGHHGLWGHHSSLAETLLRVPLVIWSHGVGLGEGRVTEPVSTVGLAEWLVGLADGRTAMLEEGGGPVVAEYEAAVHQFGGDLPPEVERRAADAGTPALVASAGVALRLGSRKVVAVEGGGERLLDLSADPHEATDLLAARPDAIEPFRPALDAWRARRASRPAPAPQIGAEAEEEIAAHLRDLGYIE